MPTYEYECDACGHEMEVFHSITAKPLRKCPKCGKPKLRRLIGTGAGVIFKGSGFYETDYRSDNYKAGAKAESDKSPAKSDTAAKSESSAGKGETSTAKSDGSGSKSESTTSKTDSSASRSDSAKSSESKSAGKSSSHKKGK
jgi:putative FmdB family regulatory protein